MKSIKIFFQLFTLFLIILFAYTGMSKLLSHHSFFDSIRLPESIKPVISYAIPVVELVTATLFCFERTKTTALWSAIILMTAFTIYVAVLLSGTKLPCSCGGVIGAMSWKQHLFFNGTILLITIAELYYNNVLRVYQGVSRKPVKE